VPQARLLDQCYLDTDTSKSFQQIVPTISRRGELWYQAILPAWHQADGEAMKNNLLSISLLPFVLAFVHSLQDCKTGLLGV